MQTSFINIEEIRNDFPILKRKVHKDKPLVYLDNAATTQKPIQVIEAISNYYMNYNSNIHRAVHELAEEATLAYETTRDKIAKFINAKKYGCDIISHWLSPLLIFVRFKNGLAYHIFIFLSKTQVN